MILNEKESKNLLFEINRMKEDLGLKHYSLDFIEKKLKKCHAVKIRTEDSLKVVSREKFLGRLNKLDDWLDETLKLKAGTIRWSNTGDLGRTAMKPL